ncbi:MAG: hypothetical protein CMK59_00550 [Proteobacteria bacterium]|nr:hypothetical protein [Pseudomonadota bacterium]
MRHPNLFLVGHPRSGTGTWDGFLKQHPNIFMGAKELHYFGRDLHFNEPPRSLNNYLSYFKEAKSEKYIGDSSTWYLSSNYAAEELSSFCPQAKIIISLRNPVSWLYSLHAHQHFAAYEPIADFEAALDAEKIRMKGDVPSFVYPQFGLFYRYLLCYDKQVERYLKHFDRSQVFITFVDDLKADIKNELKRLCSFLDLPLSQETESLFFKNAGQNRNANHKHRNQKLHRWLKTPPRRSILFGMQKPLIPGTRLFLRAVHRANMTTKPRKPIDNDLKIQLQKECKPMIQRLEALIEKDLSMWY